MSNSNEPNYKSPMIYKWIVRDKNGGLYLYETEPVITGNMKYFSIFGYFEKINSKLFPELKSGEKRQIECSIKLKGEPNNE